jgi:DnaJ-class molecular chaperone
MISYYEVLGVHENASPEQIKRAYRERMKAHHSDRHGQNDDPIVRLITEAYRVLGDPAERKQYDLRLDGHEDFSSLVSRPQQATAVTTPARTETRPREVCSRCEGRGYNPTLGVSWPCRYCDGKGWVPSKISL